MKHSYDEEDIIRFIRGKMSDEEADSFKKKISADASLATEVNDMKAAMAAIDQKGEEELKQRFKKLEKRNAMKKWIYILIAVISVLVLGFLIKKNSAKVSGQEEKEMQEIYANNFEKYRSPVSVRNSESSDDEMNKAIKAYIDFNYDEAFTLFSQSCSESNREACFYASLSAIYNGKLDFEKSKKMLVEDSSYSTILMWYEGLYYVRQNKKSEAKKIFEKLSEKGNYKKDEALKIIKLLDDM